MELRIRHLSGSKSGSEEVFESSSIRIGREPSNDVAFDPYKDIVVSGRHAEIAHDGSKWIVRDLGSSNGTYVGDERISVRALRSGDSVQLGRGGPKIEIRFNGEQIPMTIVEGFDEPMHTVVMDRDMPGIEDPHDKVTLRQGTIARLFTISTPNGPRLRVTPLALVAAAVIIAILGITAGRITKSPERKAGSSAEVEKLRNDLAARESQLKALESKVNAALSDTSGVVSQDLDRQVRSEQVLIDTLRSQLQQKNDQLVVEKSKVVTLAATKTLTPIQTESTTATAGAAASTDSAQAAELPPDNSFVKTKMLRKRINIVPEAAGDGVPAALAADFARAVGDVLVTTGDFTIDHSAPFAVKVGVAHFNVETSAAPPKSVLSKVRDTFRKNGDQQASSQNIEMAAAVSVADSQGKEIASAKPTFAVTGVPLGIEASKVALSDALTADRPDADVVRFVIANAADEAIRALEPIDPEILVRSGRRDIVALDAGRNLGIAREDVFEVLDGNRVIARARVDSIQDTTAIAFVTPANVNVIGHKVRYAGVKAANGAVTGKATLKQQVDAFEGPGTSFKAAGSVAAGSKVRVIYTVGSWSRIDRGGAAVWVPASAIDSAS